MQLDSPLQLVPEYRGYVWGGQRLRPGQVTAEAWVLYEGNRVAGGAFAGKTLAELAAQHSQALLGSSAARRTGTRFPLLVKLLDCAQWLSLQVHPNDAQAVELEGAGQNGKTEAWHILQAEEGAQIIAGMRAGVSAERLAEAVRFGSILDEAQFLPVSAGDTVFMPAGTIHALGPGLLVYEVQQVSDITYRVFDWNRPLTAGRALHIEKSLAVANPAAVGQVRRLQTGLERQGLAKCNYFRLELLDVQDELELTTSGESFHALTVIEGEAEIITPGGMCRLGQYATALVPAACQAYRVRPEGRVKALLATGAA